MATVIHTSAVIIDVTASRNPKYPHTVYFEVSDKEGRFNYSTEAASPQQLEQAKNVPCNIEMTVAGRRFERNQSLTALQISIKPTVPAAAAK